MGKEVLKKKMGKIWKISKLAFFRDVGKNLYTITFDIEVDKQHVMDGRPWLFNNKLLVLKQLDGFSQSKPPSLDTEYMYKLHVMCINRKYGFVIGKTLGEVEEVEVDADDTG